MAADVAVSGVLLRHFVGGEHHRHGDRSAAYDSSMNISTADGSCTGLTTEATSTNGTHGVAPQDTIAVADTPFVWFVGGGSPIRSRAA